MDKNKSNVTILGVFLIVSLIVIFLMGWMLVSGDYSKKEEAPDTTKIENELVSKMKGMFENTYNYVNNNMFDYIDSAYDASLNISYCSNYTFSFEEAKSYFTDRAIDNIKNKLVLENEVFYDCYDYKNTLLTNTIFSSEISLINAYELVSYTDDYVVVVIKYTKSNDESGKLYSSVINFKKVNDTWLIDSFE